MWASEFPSFSHAYTRLVQDLITKGDVVSPRGMKTYEMTDVQVQIAYPNHLIAVKGRDLKYEIGALEACSLVGQFNVPELFTERINKFKDFERNGVQWGSYGPRIAGDLGQLVQLLRDDPDTRQAVLTVFDSRRDINRGEPDIPCTIAVQFLYRNGALHMRTMMRSNDIWLGFPYDSIQFFALQSAVACALTVPIGYYYHNVGSLHLYDRDREKAEAISFSDPKVFTYPIWGATDIGSISSTARKIALGKPVFEKTPFERWLNDQLYS